MLRNVNWVRLFGSLFILLVLSVIFFIYYVVVFVVFGKYIYVKSIHDVSFWAVSYLIFTHFLVIMLLWSFIQTTITDPGKVPLHWGFHLDDIEQKKRRYCLICHIFKPDRCHHCSICNRCVLNMDHHCPWVNNCIGFHNRKFFLLVLFYGMTTLITVLSGLTPASISAVFYLIQGVTYTQEFANSIMILVSETILLVLFFLLIFFVKYHIDLLFSNTTTIEDLEKKRSGTAFNYDIGTENNFYQVFGVNPWVWPFPIYAESGKPLGDGVNWDQRFVQRDIRAEMELPSERRMDS